MTRHQKIAYLDCDPGQCEFTLGGCISLSLITQPVLGKWKLKLSFSSGNWLQSLFLNKRSSAHAPWSFKPGQAFLLSGASFAERSTWTVLAVRSAMLSGLFESPKRSTPNREFATDCQHHGMESGLRPMFAQGDHSVSSALSHHSDQPSSGGQQEHAHFEQDLAQPIRWLALQKAPGCPKAE